MENSCNLLSSACRNCLHFACLSLMSLTFDCYKLRPLIQPEKNRICCSRNHLKGAHIMLRLFLAVAAVCFHSFVRCKRWIVKHILLDFFFFLTQFFLSKPHIELYVFPCVTNNKGNTLNILFLTFATHLTHNLNF